MRICNNRDVVKAGVGGRLHSPRAAEWFEHLQDNFAMCSWGQCSPSDVNAWFDATSEYFSKEFIPHYHVVVKAAEAKAGGLPIPEKILDKLKPITKLIDEWMAYKNAFVRPTTLDWFLFGELNISWQFKVQEIVDFFDNAACQMDILNGILDVDLKVPEKSALPPAYVPDYDPERLYVGGSGGGTSAPASGKGIEVMDLVAAAAFATAAYWGWQALTR